MAKRTPPTTFDELNLQLDPQRLEQEMVLTAQRLDVAEELDRLQLHVKETTSILKKVAQLAVN